MKFFVVTTLSLGALLAGCTSTPPPAASSKSPASTGSASKSTKTSAPAPTTVAAPKEAPPQSLPALPSSPNLTLNLPSADLPPPKLSAATQALVARFTQSSTSNSAHEFSDTTGFPEAIVSLQQGVRSPKIDEAVKASSLPPANGLTADGNSTELVERDWTGLVLVPISAALSKAYTSEVRLLKTEAHPLHDGRVRIWTRVQNIGREALATGIACSFRMRKETTPNSSYFYDLELAPGAFRDVFFVSPDGELASYTVLVRNAEAVNRVR